MYSAPSLPTMSMSSFRRSPVYPVTHTRTSLMSGWPSSVGGGAKSTLSSTGTSARALTHASSQFHVTTRLWSSVARWWRCSSSEADLSTTCVTDAGSYSRSTLPPKRRTALMSSSMAVLSTVYASSSSM